VKRSNDFNVFLFYFFPVLIWMGIIFYLSSIPGLKAGFSVGREIVFRKLAHIFEFGILAGLIFRWFWKGKQKSLNNSFGLAILFSSLYAVLDEIHQLFVYGRQGKVEDLVVDFLGIIMALEILLFIINLKNKKERIINVGIFLVAFFSFVLIVFLMIQKADRIKKANLLSEKIPKSIDSQMESIVADSGSNEKKENIMENEQKEAIRNKETKKDFPEDEKKDLTESKQKENELIEEKIIKDVPFTSQAPFGIWDELHEEACEEASLIMVKFYLAGKKLTPEIAEEEIQKLARYQIEKYGDYKDSNMEKLAEIGKDFYSLDNLRVVYDFKKEDIKKFLLQGKVLIVPAAGRKLGNPFFTPPGPLYHNLVVKGIEKEELITNDPGTRRGKDFRYKLDSFYEAIFDFPGKKEDIEKGRKALIVIDFS